MEKKTNHSHACGVICVGQMNLLRGLKICNLPFIPLNPSQTKQNNHKEGQHSVHVLQQEMIPHENTKRVDQEEEKKNQNQKKKKNGRRK